jgi:hypothetical protein
MLSQPYYYEDVLVYRSMRNTKSHFQSIDQLEYYNINPTRLVGLFINESLTT